MSTDTREVLSALIDREPVSPEALADVLEDPAARALLVDFVRLREVVAADDEEAAPTVRPLVRRPPTSAAIWWRAAAAVVLVAGGAAGGFWLGEQAGQEEPPTPTRVVEFKLGVEWKPGR